MRHTIENQHLIIEVDELGAEPRGVRSAATGREYLWSGDPEHWGRCAPHLFPICGGLKDARYDYNGASYSLGQHGFARDLPFELAARTETTLDFVLRSNDETRKNYPFDFDFHAVYELRGAAVDIIYRVVNRTDGDMYFSVGAHPGFQCHGPLADYVIEFNREETGECRRINPLGIVLNETVACPFNADGRTIPLSRELFEGGCYIFRDMNSSAVSLRNVKTGEAATVEYEGFPYLLLWAPPGAPFVCLEPWYGVADVVGSSHDFTQKEGIQKLAPGAEFECVHSMIIN